MRIERVRREEVATGVRLAGDLTFEDARRAPVGLWFEVDAEVGASLAGSADPLLLAAAPAAAWSRERRILVEGTACSALRRNLEGVLRVFHAWFPDTTVPVLEASGGFAPAPARTPPRTAALFSGGIDALAALRENRLDVPLGHPASIAEGMHLFGLHARDFRDGAAVPERLADFRRHVARVRRIGEMARFEVVALRTSASLLHDTWPGWTNVGWAAVAVACGLALAPRFTDLVFASGGLGAAWPPHASNPLIDERYGSAAVRVRMAQPYLTRFEKVGLLAGWEECWPFLHPCLRFEPEGDGPMNCGRCEKCVRTMIELMAWGVLDRAPAFPEHDVRPEWIHALRSIRGIRAGFYGEEVLAALRRRGRDDLARALEARVVPEGEGPLARLVRHLRRWTGGGRRGR